MKIRVIGENGGGWRVRACVAQEFAILTVNSGEVRDHFGEPDDGEAGGVDDGFDSEGLEFWSGAAVEGGIGERFEEGGDETGGVHVAGGFAGGDEKVGRVGGGFHCSYVSVGGGSGKPVRL